MASPSFPAALPPDENRGPTIDAIAWVGCVIATIFIALRLYSRTFVTRSLDWDDAIVVFGGILNIITIALSSVSIHYGVGRHLLYLSNEQIVNALYYQAIQRPPGILAYCVPKLSVVILLVRLMSQARRGAWLLYSITIVLFITSILSFILFFAQCKPTSALWNPFIQPPPECLPPLVLNVVTYIAGSWSAFVDIVLATFPVYLLWDLKMKKSRKITAMMVMALGTFASVAAIAKTTQLSINHSKDATWEAFWLFITTYIEIDLVIIAACAPTLPKLVKKIMGKDVDGSKAPRLGYPPTQPASRGYREFGSEYD
ncbi:hypothetical protein DL769_004727 [Monosporascus sp. CRB-8-3]|nr:hypothetical protein DL769_004727 [Monosporascus sp. CRB-8-3]